MFSYLHYKFISLRERFKNVFLQDKVFHSVHSLKVLGESLHFKLGEVVAVLTPNPDEIKCFLSDLHKSINETTQTAPWYQNKKRLSATLITMVGQYYPEKFMTSLNARHKGNNGVLLIDCPRIDTYMADAKKFYRDLRLMAIKRNCAIILAVPIFDIRTREILQDLFKNKEHPTEDILRRDGRTNIVVQQCDKAMIVYKAPMLNASAVWAIKSRGNITQRKPELHVHEPESSYNAY